MPADARQFLASADCAALAGEVADEVKIGGCANPDMVALMRSWIGNERVGVVVGAVTVVDEDGDAARARAAAEVAMYLDVVGALDLDDPGRGRPPVGVKFTLAGTLRGGRRPGGAPVPARRRRRLGAWSSVTTAAWRLTTERGVEVPGCDRVLPLLRPGALQADGRCALRFLAVQAAVPGSRSPALTGTARRLAGGASGQLQRGS